jgi:hypothetical protein
MTPPRRPGRQLSEADCQAAREAAERSAREQGLPPRVVDPRVIAKVAAIARATLGSQAPVPSQPTGSQHP